MKAIWISLVMLFTIVPMAAAKIEPTHGLYTAHPGATCTITANVMPAPLASVRSEDAWLAWRLSLHANMQFITGPIVTNAKVALAKLIQGGRIFPLEVGVPVVVELRTVLKGALIGTAAMGGHFVRVRIQGQPEAAWIGVLWLTCPVLELHEQHPIISTTP
jgi:hypothetical protein